MGRNNAINQISDAHAKSIYIRFVDPFNKIGGLPAEKEMRTAARSYLRMVKKSPGEAIATPLKYK